MSEALVVLDEPSETKSQQTFFKKALILRELREKYSKGRFYLAVAATLFLVSFTISTINIPLNYDSNHNPYFSYNDLKVDENAVRDSFGFKTRQAGHKVLVIVVDGLRYDFLSSHPDLKKFMDSIEAHSKTVKLQAQLPSISHPNWMTLLTSARPQLTGITSNRDVLEAPKHFDTIFKRAQQAGLKRGLVGTSGWSAFIHDTLEIEGDASIFNIHEEESEATFRHAAGHNFDMASAKVLDRILSQQNTSNAYDFFWAYFTDVDARSHQHGPFSERAMSAVSNVTQILQNVVDKLDSKTILVITADHGHVGAGGHGGTEDVVLEIPFVMYKKGSGIGNIPTPHEWQASPSVPTNLEFAPTVCALLGLPVPLQSEGVFLDEALLFMGLEARYWHYHQLYVQKNKFVTLFGRTLGVDKVATEIGGDTLVDYRTASLNLVVEFKKLVERGMLMDGFFNLFLAGVTLCAHICLFSVVLHYMSGADLCSICGCCSYQPHQRRQNRKGFLVGTIVTFLLLIISLGVQLLIMSLSPRWYSGWQPTYSTYNSRNDTYMIVLVEGIATLVVRFLLSWILTEWVWSRFQNKILTPQEIYLAHYYTLYWVLLLSAGLLACQQLFFYYFPIFFHFRWFTPFSWNFQFIVGNLGFILVPVLIYSIISFFFFTNTEVGFDIWKERHVPPKQAEQKNLLEEESESIESKREADKEHATTDDSVQVQVVEPPKESLTINEISTDTSTDEDDHGL